MNIHVLKSVGLVPGAVIVIGAEGMIREGGSHVRAEKTASRYSVARNPDSDIAEYCKQRGTITAQCECSDLAEAIKTLCTPDELGVLKIVTEEARS